ncbi:oligosaccharide flippase family protein [Robbsia sp. KACC 23696]|uniref:oligosaccharide flippase family protein n=1 Tax=Robbsia sp. KACC 23696 TaxID=3149231 RepID=UPI00325AD506
MRAAAHNLFWLAAERLTQLGVAIVVSGLLARYLGADLFGKWQYANTLLTVVAPLTWICGAEILVPAIVAALHARTDPVAAKATDASQSVARTPGRDADADANASPHRRPPMLGTILGSAFALRFGVSAIALLLVWGALAGLVFGMGPGATDIDPQVAAMLAGLAATMLFREPFGVISTWLQARTYSKPALVLSLGTALAKAVVLALLVKLAVPAGALGWLWAAESAVIAAGLALYYRRFWRRHPVDAQDQAVRAEIRWRVDGGLLRTYLHSGAVFWIGLVCMYVFMKLDRLVLQHYADYATLGRYAASQQLTENWITVALMLAQTVGPAFIYRAENAAALQRNLWRLLTLTLIAMSVGALLLSAAAPWIVRLVFGPGFDAAASYLAWASWIGVLAGLEAIANLIALKFQARRLVLGKWLTAMVLAFGVDIALVPHYGGYGALAGLAVGYVAALIADLRFARSAIRRMRLVEQHAVADARAGLPGAALHAGPVETPGGDASTTETR